MLVWNAVIGCWSCVRAHMRVELNLNNKTIYESVITRCDSVVKKCLPFTLELQNAHCCTLLVVATNIKRLTFYSLSD